jgi:trehalose 6-phosphate synthase
VTAEPFATDLPVIVVSNRGPVSFSREDGERVPFRGAGGLVTALIGLADHLDNLVWVCGAASDEDVEISAEAGDDDVAVGLSPDLRLLQPGEKPGRGTVRLRYVDVPAEQYDPFYTVVANPLLWFVQHGMYGLALDPDITRSVRSAFDDGYVPVNRAFAEATVEVVRRHGDRALVLLQDYHFYLVAPHVRAECPEAVISQFVHIPWPGPDAWRVLPPPMREPVLRGLLGNDVVAFHTEAFARNFVLCAQELLGLHVDIDTLTIDYEDRVVLARYYPISIDAAAFDEMATSDEVEHKVRALDDELLAGHDGKLIVRVDRTDPSKNIVRGFKAFGLMLEEHPELVGQATFLALLQPSRLDVPEYDDYLAALAAEAARINARHARSGYRPVELRLVEDQALAGRGVPALRRARRQRPRRRDEPGGEGGGRRRQAGDGARAVREHRSACGARRRSP